jgi:hypothetical protein
MTRRMMTMKEKPKHQHQPAMMRRWTTTTRRRSQSQSPRKQARRQSEIRIHKAPFVHLMGVATEGKKPSAEGVFLRPEERHQSLLGVCVAGLGLVLLF